ncbi:sporulation histidine kinase inhibitor Sda [Paenibacillus athensensis]|uniref:Sporulation inhibitor A n=1 Tax=Paenibacillus athensensis TaxID=1967502 RepID=A0A4Y8Q0L8_9BACL|nr:sporulation histidine kinase inhibitor Sda [Paenibacillus athensensis]MCD1258301.1 sporulation histidine kinase inhibitor Sda [Paenibacillus athensensis]
MTTATSALHALPSEHLIECLRLAMGMNLDPEFIMQLRDEINRRQISGTLQFSLMTDEAVSSR